MISDKKEISNWEELLGVFAFIDEGTQTYLLENKIGAPWTRKLTKRTEVSRKRLIAILLGCN